MQIDITPAHGERFAGARAGAEFDVGDVEDPRVASGAVGVAGRSIEGLSVHPILKLGPQLGEGLQVGCARFLALTGQVGDFADGIAVEAGTSLSLWRASLHFASRHSAAH
ncbi:hypothetical protein [Nocardia gipuzkoensis]|uniref:hypothetical protein n=1 Tax=Nocardia gipuzkoensis TaxID=2749991 RepID=UPI00237D532B|nr:hypothetical protein [Nocardia gipuzkoensis]MDE1669304.1 hypothetical protein [Nocardia gipuzkoensis]